MTFQSANSFACASISDGIVETQTNGALGPGQINIGGNAVWKVTTLAQNCSNGVALGNGGGILSVDASKLTLSGSVSGPGGITKTGSGVLELTGVNTFSGMTTVSSGTLQGNVASLPAGVTLANGTRLILNQTADATFNSSVCGNGGLTLTGGSVLTLRGAASYVGDTTISAGTLRLAVAPTAPPSGSVVWLDASTLNLANGASVTGLADLSPIHNDAVANGAPTFNANGLNGKGTITFAGTQSLTTQRNLSITGNANRSMFVVMRRNGDAETGTLAVQMGNGTGGQGWGLTSQANWFGTYVIQPGGAQGNLQAAGVYGIYDSLHQTGTPTGGGTNYLYVNGKLAGTGTNTPDIGTGSGPTRHWQRAGLHFRQW